MHAGVQITSIYPMRGFTGT